MNLFNLRLKYVALTLLCIIGHAPVANAAPANGTPSGAEQQPDKVLSPSNYLTAEENARLLQLGQKVKRTPAEDAEFQNLAQLGTERRNAFLALPAKEKRAKAEYESLMRRLNTQMSALILLDEAQSRRFGQLTLKHTRTAAETAELQSLTQQGNQKREEIARLTSKPDHTPEENLKLQSYQAEAKRNAGYLQEFMKTYLGSAMTVKKPLILPLLDSAEVKRFSVLTQQAKRTDSEEAELQKLAEINTSRGEQFRILGEKASRSPMENNIFSSLRDNVMRNAPALSQVLDDQYAVLKKLNEQTASDVVLPVSEAPTTPIPDMAAFLGASPDNGTKTGAGHKYPTRKGLVVNLCPSLKLTQFDFARRPDTGSEGHVCNYQWMNTGKKAIVAFEVVTLKYDAFGEALKASLLIVPGHNTSNYDPLAPGEHDMDSIGLAAGQNIYMAIAYVRRVKLSDGSIWQIKEPQLLAELKKAAPTIRQFGPLLPN